MPRPQPRRQIWSVNSSGRLLNKNVPPALLKNTAAALAKPNQDFQLPYEDAGEHMLSSHTINYELGEHCFGSFHAHPGETVKVETEVDEDGAQVTTITRTPDPED